ncbi:MAG: MerR family transcriptional regulator [Spirochaetaceae bacterium]|nr:MerR family transcriptional regulator [Spirochaetaceae bacterium]
MSKGYTIRMAAQLSGLTPYVIRAWEKRYNAVTPSRSEGNQRTYSEEDVRRLKLLSGAVKSGCKISRIVSMPDDELEQLSESDSTHPDSSLKQQAKILIDSCLEAVSNMDAGDLEDHLTRAVIDFDIIDAVDMVVVPLMEELGEGWHQGRWRISHEHMASAVVRNFLANQLRSFDSTESAHAVIVMTPSGQLHELGSLSAALAAASAGFHVIYLGSNIPASEIVRSADETGAVLVLVSIVFPGSTTRIRQEIDTLRRFLPKSCRLIIGGSSAGPYLLEGDIRHSQNMKLFRKELLDIRRSIPVSDSLSG